MTIDAWIVGTGPAAWALAGQLKLRGLKPGLVSPSPEQVFIPTYGAWYQELLELGYSQCVEQIYPDTCVYLQNEKLELGRQYARLNTESLYSTLRKQAQNIYLLPGKVVDIRTCGEDYIVQLSDGNVLKAPVVIDASGHESQFARNVSASGWQMAYGVKVKVKSKYYDQNTAVLMDFRDMHLSSLDSRPSFLYALPLADGSIFFEETSLVSNPPMSFEELARRLSQRLSYLGIEVVGSSMHTEYCKIPMGSRAPSLSNIVGFGGAANMVHPATGYQLTRVLRKAPQVAEAICNSMSCASLSERSKIVWNAVWSPHERHIQRLHCLGTHVLLDLDRARLESFMRTFFCTSGVGWYSNMTLSQTPIQLQMGMLSLFGALNLKLKAIVLGAILRRLMFGWF